MKKLLTAAVLALLGTGAFAQTTSGSIVVSGSLGITRSQDKRENPDDPRIYTSTNINFRPSAGYLVSDGLELGLTLGLSYSKNKVSSDKENAEFTNETTFTGIEFSPYLRKYFMLSDKVAFTGTLSAGGSLGKNKSENSFGTGTMESTRNSLFVNIVPGLTYFPTEKFGLSTYFGSLGYQQATIKPDNGFDKIIESDFGLNLSSSTFGIGFSYYINR